MLRLLFKVLIFALGMQLAAGCSNANLNPSKGAESNLSPAKGCGEDEYSSGIERIGVMRSRDQGASWHFLGHACFHAPELIPVDPSPLAINDSIVLYFLDLRTLNASNSDRLIYRASTLDGLEFSQPMTAFGYPDNITDPYVLQLPNGLFRMFVARPLTGDVIMASSGDGNRFDIDQNDHAIAGGTPGALHLPDGQLRLFTAGPEGITSLISADGRSYSRESGIRIPSMGIRVTDPHPIRLRSGGYLMVFVVHPQGDYPTEKARLASLEIRLAKSSDALEWSIDPRIVGLGSVPGIVETREGDLYIYYVDVVYGQN